LTETVHRINYRPFNNDAFWRVSADTKTCGSPLYLRLLAVYVNLLAPKGQANIRVF